VATGLNMVTGTALRNGKLYATIDSLIPGSARVVRID